MHRAPLWPNHDARAIARMANYLSFAAGASVVARTRVPRPDVWLVTLTPATAVVPVVRLLRRHRVPYFLLVQDLWARQRHWQRLRRGRGGLGRRERAHPLRTRPTATPVASASSPPAVRRVLVDRRVPTYHLVHDTPNWISDDHLLPAVAPDHQLRSQLGLPPGRLWMYAGNLGELQGLDGLIEASCPATRGAIRPPRRQGRRAVGWSRWDAKLGATNIRFTGSVATSEVGRWIAASDVRVSLQDTPLLRVTMPRRCRPPWQQPVRCSSMQRNAASVVTEGQSGWAATPGDPTALDAAIEPASRPSKPI